MCRSGAQRRHSIQQLAFGAESEVHRFEWSRRHDRRVTSPRYLIAAVLVPVAGWLGLFAWDTDRSNGGPWSAWQVALYVLLLIGVGLWVACHEPGVAIFVIPFTVT